MGHWLTEDVDSLWPHLSADQAAKVTRWVDQAERLIATRFPDITTRVVSGALTVEVIGDVVEAMVTRALDDDRRGGMDKLSYPEVSMEWDNSGGVGTGSKLYLTTDELILLSPPKPTGAFTIRPTGHLPRGPMW